MSTQCNLFYIIPFFETKLKVNCPNESEFLKKSQNYQRHFTFRFPL